MKKLWGTIAIMLVGATIGFYGCDNGGNESGSGAYMPVAKSENVRYTATYRETPVLSDHKAEYSFYDNENYYYMFYLGDITHVPLQNNAAVFEYNGNDYRREFSTTTTTATTVSSMVSTMQEKCVENSSAIKGEAGVKLAEKVELGLSLEYKNSVAETITQEQSYEKAQEYSEEQAESVTFEFNSSCKQGYYRYILLGDVEVFGVVVKNIQNGEYYTDIYNILVSQYFTLDYSTVSTFYDNNYGKLTFEISENEVAALQEPTLSIEEVQKEESSSSEDLIDPDAYKTAKVVYDTGLYPIIVTDTAFQYDPFSISELSPYMTDEYILHFKIELLMREKDAGYQEMHLYNGNGTWLCGVSDYTYGGNGLACTTASWISLNWSVNGANCTEQMKMGYTAHAGGADTWIIEDTKITITVSRKN